jgi:dCTP deaminase
MILSDSAIMRLMDRKNDPLIMHHVDYGVQVQPCSIDMRLDNEIALFKNKKEPLHVRCQPQMETISLGEYPYLLNPGEFILGSTKEYFQIPCDHAAQVDGKSSLGRLGLLVHITAGWIDPGFKGNITLEICNINSQPIYIYHEMYIAQLIIMQLSGQVIRPYGSDGLNSKYQNSKGVIPMRPEN